MREIIVTMHCSAGFQINDSYPLSFFLLLLMMFPLASWAENDEPWGTRPYSIEKPLYDELIKKANQEFRKAKHRKEQNSSLLRIYLGDISNYDYQQFEEWYNRKSGIRSPEVKFQLDWLKDELEDARKSYFIYSKGRASPDDPKFGAGVRDTMWPAHLKMLNLKLKYYDFLARDEETRRIAAERYTEEFYMDLFKNALTGMQYIMKKHSEQFFADLADCAGRVMMQATGSALMKGYSGGNIPSSMSFMTVPGFGMNSITGTDGNALSCLKDSVRNSIVHATTNGIRYNFITKVTKTWQIPDVVAEYWWVQMINPGDSEESPWAPQYKSMYARITEGAINSIKRVADKNNLIEHSKDMVKIQWEKKIRPRLTKQARKAAIDHKKLMYQLAKKDGHSSSVMKDIHKNSANTARKYGKEAVEQDVQLKWLKAADYLITVVETTYQSVYLNAKIYKFEASAKPIVDEYKRIVSCLKKQEMSSNPQSVIMIYKLKKKQDVADFFARCDEKMSDQMTEQSMNEGQELTRRLYRLLELAREIHGKNYSSCQSTLDSAADLFPQVDPENAITPDDLASRLAGFKESASAIVTNTQEVEVRGKIIAEAKSKVDQIVAQACQNSSPVSKSSNSENTVAHKAQHYSTTSTELLIEIEALQQESEMLSTLVIDEAALLADASRETAPLSTEDTQRQLVEIKENIEGTQSSADKMAQIVSDAQAEYKRQVSILGSTTTDTATRLLADSRSWLNEIEQLANDLSDCRGQLQSVMNHVSKSERQDTAVKNFISRGDIQVLADQAVKAFKSLNTTLGLAEKNDKFIQLKMDETNLCLDRNKMQGILSLAQSTEKNALTACDTARQKAHMVTAQLSKLTTNNDTLTREAQKHIDNLLKLEAMSREISGYRNEAKAEASNAHSDQSTAKQLKVKACQHLQKIKSSQSIDRIQAALGQIQGAVSSCKSLSRKVHQSAINADGSASASQAINTAMANIVISPMASIDGQTLNIKADIDALNAISTTTKAQAVKIRSSSGQAKKILAKSQSSASRLHNNKLSQTTVSEMSAIVNKIDAMYNKILACSGEIKNEIGQLNARQTELYSSGLTLSNKIKKVNSALQSGGLSKRSNEDTEAAKNFAEMAGWSAEGMNEVLIAVASCQAAAEIILSKAQAANKSCQSNGNCSDSASDSNGSAHNDSASDGDLFTSSGGESGDDHEDRHYQDSNNNDIATATLQTDKHKQKCTAFINNISSALRNKNTESAQHYTNMATAEGCDINTGYVDSTVSQIKEEERKRKEQLEKERQQQLAEQERQRQENQQQQAANDQKNMQAMQTMVGSFSQMMENKRNRDKSNKNNTSKTSQNKDWKALGQRTYSGTNKHVTPPASFPAVNNPGMPGSGTSHSGAKYCKSHTEIICSGARIGGSASLDNNSDGLCDICNLPYKKDGRYLNPLPRPSMKCKADIHKNSNKQSASKKPAYTGLWEVRTKIIQDNDIRYGKSKIYKSKLGKTGTGNWRIHLITYNGVPKIDVEKLYGIKLDFQKPVPSGSTFSTTHTFIRESRFITVKNTLKLSITKTSFNGTWMKYGSYKSSGKKLYTKRISLTGIKKIRSYE